MIGSRFWILAGLAALLALSTAQAASGPLPATGARLQATDSPPIFLPLLLYRPVPAAPALQPIENPGRSSSFDLSWSASPTAAAYVLEEAGDPEFTSPILLYRGPHTSFRVMYRPAGIHYYRVKALLPDSETGWSAPQMTEVAESVHLVSSTGFSTQAGEVVIVGELHNTLAQSVTDLEVSARLFDDNGTPVISDTSPALIDYVLVNMTTPFKLVFSGMPEAKSYELIVSGAQTDLAPYVLEIVRRETYTDEQNAYHVTGQTYNPNPESVDSAEAFVTLYGDDFNVIGVNSGPTTPSQLAPQGTATFDVAVDDYLGKPDPSNVATYLVQVFDDTPAGLEPAELQAQNLEARTDFTRTGKLPLP